METINIGQELKELTGSISGLVQAIEYIRETVASSLENLPKASEKLDKITGETELATNELMDILDSLSESDSIVSKLVDELGEKLSDNPEGQEIVVKIKKIIEDNTDSHTKILETLQFQDLTTQQINYVATLIDKIEDEIKLLHSAFSEGEIKESRKVRNVAFDKDADFSIPGQGQDDVDSILGALNATKDD